MRNLVGGIGKNQQRNILTYQKSTSVEQKLEGIDKAIEGEVSKGIRSVFQSLGARMNCGAKADATLANVHIKSESSARIHPGLEMVKTTGDQG